MRNRNRIFNDIDRSFAGARSVNILRLAAAVAVTETVTIGRDVYEVWLGGAAVTSGRIAVDLSAGGTKATGTITSDATAPSDGDTVTIDTKVYTFKTALTPTEGEVLIGADAAAALDNLKLAINRTDPTTNDGVKYKIAAAHTTVSATTNTDTTQVVQALLTGTGPNSIETTEDGSHTSWGAATLASGANPTAAQASTGLALAINTGAGLEPVGAVAAATYLKLFSTSAGVFALACTETLAGSNNGWASATMVGGEGPQAVKRWSAKRVPTATEVTLGILTFSFPFAVDRITSVVVTVTSTGAVKVIDGSLAVVSGNHVTLDNTGNMDWAATDTVVLTAESV